MYIKRLMSFSLSFMTMAGTVLPVTTYAEETTAASVKQSEEASTQTKDKNAETYDKVVATESTETNSTESKDSSATATEQKEEAEQKDTEKQKDDSDSSSKKNKNNTDKSQKKITPAKTKKIKKKEVKEEKITAEIKPKSSNTYEKLSLEIKNNKEYLGNSIYLCQGDAAWNQSGYSIATSGCGPTAISTCIVNLLGKWITPVDVAKWGYQHGYYSGAGSTHEGIPAMTKHFGLNCVGVGTDYDEIKQNLKKGNYVIGLMGPGYFTKGGHFIVLIDIDENDHVTVADVASRKRSSYKYQLKDVIRESKTAGGGGPFWVVSRSENKSAESKKKDQKSVIKDTKEKTTKKSKAIHDFYKEVPNCMDEMELKIPRYIAYSGIKNVYGKNTTSQINVKLKQLGQQLNDQYLINISETYLFGIDKVGISNTDGDEFDLIKYLYQFNMAEKGKVE